MKTVVIATGVLLLLIFVSCAPIISISNKQPDGVWQDLEFELQKPKLQETAKKLNALEEKARQEGFELSSTYGLVCTHGSRSGKRSLIGLPLSGSIQQGTWTFGAQIIGGLPFFDYSEDQQQARLRPEKCAEFVAWVDRLDAYPKDFLSKKQPAILSPPMQE